MRLLLLLLIFVSQVFGDCASQKDCNSCKAQNGNCGWCEVGNKDPNKVYCFDGTPAGPHDSSACSDGLWWWNKCDDYEDTCLYFTSCDSCVSHKTPEVNCGWCDDACLVGNATGPRFVDRHEPCKQWSYQSCSGRCNGYTDCFSCVESDCGWCNVTNKCASFEDAGACSLPLKTMCQVKPVCYSKTSCDDCVAAECSWCADNNKCLTNYEAVGSCSVIRKGTCAADCTQFTRCSDCTKNTECGWCDSKCLPGSSTGPSGSSLKCNNWLFKDCSTGLDCTKYSNCDGCTASQLCGWCENNRNQFCEQKQSDACDLFVHQCPQPPTPCETQKSCKSCLEDEQCAWCDGKCTSKNNQNSGCKDSCGLSGGMIFLIILLVGVVLVALLGGLFAVLKIFNQRRQYQSLS